MASGWQFLVGLSYRPHEEIITSSDKWKSLAGESKVRLHSRVGSTVFHQEMETTEQKHLLSAWLS